MPAYHEAFLCGENVKIKPFAFLKQYARPEWPYHNPLVSELLEFAGQVVNISGVSYYHGGDILYRLRGFPGYLHEACVEDYLLSDPDWEGYPKPAEYFAIEAVKDQDHEYVRVVARDGMECMRRLVFEAEMEANLMREVAELRHFRGFLNRYQLWHPFQPPRESREEYLSRRTRQQFGLSSEVSLPNDEFTAELIEAVTNEPEYPAIRPYYANKPFPSWGAPGWQRSVNNPEILDEDRKFQLLSEFYIRANAHQRQSLRNRNSNESLYHFVHRMAVRALRTNSDKEIELAVAALSIQDLADGRDLSELYFHFLILRRVARRIGADFVGIVERIAQISTPYTARAFRQHAQIDEPKTLPFDIEEFDDEHGPTIGWRH